MQIRQGIPSINVTDVHTVDVAGGYKVCLTMRANVLENLRAFFQEAANEKYVVPNMFAKEFIAHTDEFDMKLITVLRLAAVRLLFGIKSGHVEADFICHNISVERTPLHYAFWKDLKMWRQR